MSCENSQNSENRRIVNEWIGKEIVFPNQDSENNVNKCNDDNLKIVTRINGNCYPCLVQLKLWKKLIEELKSKHTISFYIFIVANDYEIFESVNEKEIHFDYPVIYDRNDEFYKKNRLPQRSYLQTMLLTDKNKVILIGNPVVNDVLKDLYIEQIKKYHNEI